MQQQIQYQSALASLTDAEQNYQIQLGQNDSDIKAAQQKARFARMDFDKYLGDSVTGTIIVEVGLDKILAAINSNSITASTIGAPNKAGGQEVKPATVQTPVNVKAMAMKMTVSQHEFRCARSAAKRGG